MTDTILIPAGTVLTLDPQLDEMHNADLLIEDDKITAVGSATPSGAG